METILKLTKTKNKVKLGTVGFTKEQATTIFQEIEILKSLINKCFPCEIQAQQATLDCLQWYVNKNIPMQAIVDGINYEKAFWIRQIEKKQ